MATVTEVAPDVYWVDADLVNWYLLVEGTDCTLVDTGYPGDTPDVEASIRAIGRDPRDLSAVLITHGHIDHLGAIGHLHRNYGTPILLDPTEAARVRTGDLQQADVEDLKARAAVDPAAASWLAAAMLREPTRSARLPEAEDLPATNPLDLPGRPIAIRTGGHSDGHTAFHLPAVGALLSGDLVVTGHQISDRDGPQVLDPVFQHDLAAMSAALDTIADLDAGLLLPGHGAPAAIAASEAVAVARDHLTA